MSAENDRPLAGISDAERAVQHEKLRGEIAILRLTITALDEEIERTERFNERALEIAQTGLDKHLLTLNDNTGKLLAAQEKHARDMIEAQARLQSIDAAGRDKREIDARITKVEERQSASERSGGILQGKLGLPLAIFASVVSAVAVAVAIKLLYP